MPDRQAAMMEKNNNFQPEDQLSAEQLLREDEAPGEIVWAQVTPETDEAGEAGQIEEVSEVASPGGGSSSGWWRRRRGSWLPQRTERVISMMRKMVR